MKQHILQNGVLIQEYNNKSFAVHVPGIGNKNIHSDAAKYLIEKLKI